MIECAQFIIDNMSLEDEKSDLIIVLELQKCYAGLQEWY